MTPLIAGAAPGTAPDAGADSRFAELAGWLATLAERHGLRLDSLAPASADASFRRYFRIACQAADGAAGTLIVMDAPPPEKCREFVAVAGLLQAAGVHVPQVLAHDFTRGFMLLTDLGVQSYLGALNPATAPGLLRAALDTLIRWQLASRPGVLPEFDEAFLYREMELLPQWYLGRHLGREALPKQREALDRTFKLLAGSALAQPQGFMLRDFMPRNLMVSVPNPGVLDFQDAVWGPLTYDVVSLLRDAFISWDEEFELDCFVYYWERAKRAGLAVDADFGEYYRQLEWMGLQRHLKIIGLFARIHYRDGKPDYLADLPRFIGYARKVAVRYRPLAPLARLLDEIESAGENTGAVTGYTF